MSRIIEWDILGAQTPTGFQYFSDQGDVSCTYGYTMFKNSKSRTRHDFQNFSNLVTGPESRSA
jgi:hypothetical protein